jgi:hypothetical protein
MLHGAFETRPELKLRLTGKYLHGRGPMSLAYAFDLRELPFNRLIHPFAIHHE